MTESMRITTNHGRHTRGRAYSPRHNDRQFNLQNAPHIDPAHTADSWTWTWLENYGRLCSFEDAEREYYARYISDHLRAVNARYEAQRHAERMRSLDEYRRAPQSCPEETIVCIGNREHHPDPGELLAAYLELQHWQQQTYPQLHVLDYAMHLDEQGAPHIHERHVWTYTDADGHLAIGQARALEQMGVQRPHPEQPRSRYNNEKMTYTQAVREKFVAICRQRGLEIKTQPRERSQMQAMKKEVRLRTSFLVLTISCAVAVHRNIPKYHRLGYCSKYDYQLRPLLQPKMDILCQYSRSCIALDNQGLLQNHP